MSAPLLGMLAEPRMGKSAAYGLLAARTSNDSPQGQLSLVLTISNHEPAPVHLNQITVSFVGSPSVSPSSMAADLTFFTNQVLRFFFEAANTRILPIPAPATIRFALFCDGFSEPAQIDLPLVQYVSPAEGGGYAFPARADELEEGEFWAGISATHASGFGTQLFAYDLGVFGFDSAINQWRTVKPGEDDTKNESYHVWRKPVYAMADGLVTQFKDGIPPNTPPGLPDPPPALVEGNHFYVQHGPDLALYAHLVAGTLNPALTSGPNPDGSGATVTKGQLLGLAGNSGNSSEPHLHVHLTRPTAMGGLPSPLPFKDIFVLDLSVVDPKTWPPNTDTPWNDVVAECLPSVFSAIWPGTLRVGGKVFLNFFHVFAWVWFIVIGGLMITPGGVQCIVCGPVLTKVLGIVSILIGTLGLVLQMSARSRKAPAPRVGSGMPAGAASAGGRRLDAAEGDPQ